MTGCLEENEIVDFVAGNLDPEDAARAEAHIDQCASCRAVLIELARVFELRASALPALEERSDDATERSEPASLGLLPPELLRGSKVGRYMMLEMLGTGAMGVVFSAYDPELDRKVAVKLLRDRTGDEERNARMIREARATARLAHPNVVVVHDVGEFEGNVFMAMELVTGGTLGDWLEREDRPREVVIDAFLEAGEGLAAAHQAGLVHRDFKPANVLMGDNGRPRVTDFGLARAGDSAEITHDDTTISGSLDVAVTKTGALIGTPAYMSPEQFEGKVADAQSDQFSFCVALVEALTGKRPFAGKSLMELQATVCAGTLRPGALDGLPRPIQAALQRGLQQDPDDRHPSMEALLRVLRRLRRRSPGKTLARSGLLAVAVLGGAGAAWAGSQARVEPVALEMCTADAPQVSDVWTSDQRSELAANIAAIDRPAAPRIAESVVESLDVYAAAWDQSRGDACVSDDELGARFARLRCLDRGRVELDALLYALSEADPAVLEHAEQAIRDLPQPQACADPAWRDVVRAEPPEAIRDAVREQEVGFEIAKAFLTTGQYSKAASKAAVVASAVKALGHPPLSLDAMLVQATALSRSGGDEDSLAVLRVAWVDSIRANDARAQVRVAAMMIDVLGNQKLDVDEGRVWIDVAAAALERLDDDDPAAWDFWDAVGDFHAYAGEYDEALAAYERALEVPGTTYGQQLATKHARLSVKGLRTDAAEQEQLVSEAQELVEGLRETLGPDHPSLVWVGESYAGALTLAGRGEEALAVLEESMRIADSVLELDDERLVGLLTSRASALRVAGELSRARDDAARVVEIREAHPSDPLALGLAYNNLAVMEQGLGKYEASNANLEKALPLMAEGFGAEHINVANVHTTLGSSLISLEKFEEARSHLEQAKAIAKAFGPGSARLDPLIDLNLARVELRTGNLEAATELTEAGVRGATEVYGDAHPLLAKFHSTEAEVAIAAGNGAEALRRIAAAEALAKDAATQDALNTLRERAEAL